MKLYTAAGTLVLTKSLPPVERYIATGLFEVMQPLNSSFAVGRYYARYTWTVSATDFVGVDCFEIVAGGDADGQYTSAFFLMAQSGDADWILANTDQGTQNLGRGPHT